MYKLITLRFFKELRTSTEEESSKNCFNSLIETNNI